MKALALAIACVALARTAAAAEPVFLDEKQVFPGDDGADPATLDQPLTDRVAAYLAKAGKKKFAKRIVVHKAQRRMDVYADDTILKSYVVDLGFTPAGSKEHEGDGKTPEGDMYVCAVNKVSQFTRFLALAYPTPPDAQRGRASGLVGADAQRAIEAAFKTRRACPPQTTKLGGMVGIHGKGGWAHANGRFAVEDWTFGCVGLRDPDILELFEHYAEVGIPVRIDP